VTESERTPAAKRILVVDDEPHVCDIISRWLAAEGYECETANTAGQAWRLLDREPFALMVSDIAMPGRSGIELLEMVKSKHPETAVIMVTAVDDRATAIQALELGAYGYVIKPFERNELVIGVVNALERRRLWLYYQDHERQLRDTIQRQTEEICRSREEIVLRLMATHDCSPDESNAHIRRVGLYAQEIACSIGYTDEQADNLRLAASLHDIGKVHVPTPILLKPGKLTSDEWDVMKEHTTSGAQILTGTASPLLDLARDIALCHHEKWDGTGYPRGLAGANIPEAARITAVADAYDALVHSRVYRPAMPEEQALSTMRRERGTQFDSNIFDAFLAKLPEIRRIRSQVSEQSIDA